MMGDAQPVLDLLQAIATTPDELETMKRQWYERERLLIVYRHPDDAPDRWRTLFIDPRRVHIADQKEGESL